MQKFVQFVQSIDPSKILEYTFFLSKKLDTKVDLYKVLQYYDIAVSSKSDEEQVECKLPTHFGIDRNKSARYYSKSDTGVSRVYCFKCSSTLSAFWYFHKMEKDSDLKTSEIIIKFVKEFSVETTDDFFTFEQQEDSETSEISVKQEIDYFRALKFHNLDEFSAELIIYINDNF